MSKIHDTINSVTEIYETARAVKGERFIAMVKVSKLVGMLLVHWRAMYERISPGNNATAEMMSEVSMMTLAELSDALGLSDAEVKESLNMVEKLMSAEHDLGEYFRNGGKL